jgi:CRP-like cAMP-binding protein
MSQDRIGSKELPLTHEFLAIMLGVRRPSVTDVLQVLEQKKLIKGGRGKIEIIDRPGLERMSCECYRRTNEEFERQFG